ncbi:MAG: restriction endonuclease subunit S [Acidobacteriota bacterium]
MSWQETFNSFEAVTDAPGGIGYIRQVVFELAISGQLVRQDRTEAPATDFLGDRVLEDAGNSEDASIPSRWAYSSIELLGSIVGGGTPSKKNDSFWHGDIPWISPKDMKRDFIGESQDYITEAALGSSSAKLIPHPSLLFVVRGMILAHSFPVALTTVDATVNQDMKALVPFDAQLSPYLLLLFKGLKRRVLDLVARSTHGTCKLPTKALFSLPLPIPPLAEQHRIVARVDELMALLDRLEEAKKARDATRAHLRDAVLAALQAANDAEEVKTAWSRIADYMHDLFADPADILPLRSTILELAVHGHLVPQDSADDSANALLEKVAAEKTQLVQDGKIREPKALPPLTSDETPFALPDGWVWCRLGQVLLEIEAGWSPSALKRPKEGREWGVLKVSSCSWGTFRPDENKALPPGTHPRVHLEVRDGDFLISRANTIELVARSVVVVEPPERLMLSDKTLRLTPSSNACVGYLNLVNLCKSSRQHYGKHATGTSASMRNVSQGAIRELPIPLPPAAEQSRILEKVEELTTLLDRLEETLRASRESQEAFSASVVRAMPEDRLGVEEGSAVAVG